MAANHAEGWDVLATNQLEDNVTEYVFRKCRVRIHPGKLTEEERRAVYENAGRKLLRAVEKNKVQKAKREQDAGSVSGDVDGDGCCGAAS